MKITTFSMLMAFMAIASLAQAGTLPKRLAPVGVSTNEFLEMAVTNSRVVSVSVGLNPGNPAPFGTNIAFKGFTDYQNWVVKEGLWQYNHLKTFGQITDQTAMKLTASLSVETAWESAFCISQRRNTTFGDISEASFRDMPITSARIPVYIKDLYSFEVRLESTPECFLSKTNSSTLYHYYWEDNRGKVTKNALGFNSIGEPMPNVVVLDMKYCTAKYFARITISTKNWDTGEIETASYTQCGEKVSYTLKIERDFIKLEATAGSIVNLQESTDLRSWSTIYQLQNQSGTAFHGLPIYTREGSPRKFYRAHAY